MENSLINKLVCTFFLILVAASGLQAEPLSITATVSRTRLAVNQQLALTIELSGDGAQRAEQPELPDMGGYLTFLGSGGTSQNMSFVNGKMSVSKSFTFYYLAAKAGTFTIPPIKVVHKNKTIQSQPITLTITPSSTPPSPDRQKQGRTDNKNSENLYIRTLVNKKTVFQNEPIVVTYRIYAAVSVTGYSIIKLPETTGFWVEDIEMPPQPEVKEEIINGQRYVTADIKKMTLFPTSPGKRSIGPLSLQCEVKEQTRRRSRDIFDSFFDDGFFGRTVRKTISSPIAEINVKPLPRIDKPDSFSGVVGQFKITASVDKNTVKTDEAVTLTVTLSGVGNIRTLSEPVVQIPPDFEQYEPTISEKIDRTNGVISGSKTFEYVLVPRFPGMQRIKPIEFSYFDPKTKSYKIVRSPELLINVEKGAGQIVRSGGSGLSKEEIERMRKEAEEHAEEDRRRRELVELKNSADALIYNIEKILKEQGDKIPADERSNVESAISNLREAMKSDDAQAIKRAMENLEKSSHKIAEEMYKATASQTVGAQSAGQTAQEQPGSEEKGKSDEDVIDAEYDVKE